MRKVVRIGIGFLFTALLALTIDSGAVTPGVTAAAATNQRYNITVKRAQGYQNVRAAIIKAGGKVVIDLPQVNTITATSTDPKFKATLLANNRVKSVAKDRVRQLIRPSMQREVYGHPLVKPTGKPARRTINATKNAPKKTTNTNLPADPGSGVLNWDLGRINAPQAWNLTTGDPSVIVAVEDTGVDYTHVEIAPRYDASHSHYFGDTACALFFGQSDADLAGGGVKADNDFNGHGSWIAGNIGASLNGKGINGIAPNIKIASLKIADWCGFAFDSTINNAFVWGADHGVDIISISFGGYIDRSEPDQEAEYQTELAAANYARSHGTLIVAAAGNEHVRLGANGQVTSHGELLVPGNPDGEVVDYFGQWETPGGLPGVISVAATGNVTNAPTASPQDSTSPACTESSTELIGFEWCKPATDPHQPFGVGLKNQLAYYSNYGPGIDVAAPGGARKFNLPLWDRGGTPGWPYTGIDSLIGGEEEGYNVWEDFSITSNYAQVILCFRISGLGFPPDQCYATIQGTSMATPHVAAVAALIASRNTDARHHPDRLEFLLKQGADHSQHNLTPALSATDKSPGDATDVSDIPCDSGYCHLGGPPISDADAYGGGFLDAFGVFSAGR